MYVIRSSTSLGSVFKVTNEATKLKRKLGGLDLNTAWFTKTIYFTIM
jgi:hypothetical protein